MQVKVVKIAKIIQNIVKMLMKMNETSIRINEKQQRDKERGSTYGTGVSVSILIPEEVRRKENEIKQLLDCRCDLYECYTGGHKTKASKRCKYHTCTTMKEVYKQMDEFMRFKYPNDYYGEKIPIVCEIIF